MLSYSKYSLLVLTVVGIEPETSWWFNWEASYPMHHVSLTENSERRFGTYKLNVLCPVIGLINLTLAPGHDKENSNGLPIWLK